MKPARATASTLLRRIACGLLGLVVVGGAGPTLASAGIWTSAEELAGYPTDGAVWEGLLEQADLPTGVPDLSYDDDKVNTRVMAKAIVFARTGEERYRQDVISAIETITFGNTEADGQSLALARELGAYVIAADLVGLPAELDAEFRVFLGQVRDRALGGRTLISTHEDRPNNWGTHAGFSRAVVALYLDDLIELERCYAVFLGWLGDRSSYAGFTYGGSSEDLSWQADPAQPVGINPLGASKQGQSIDGALPEEMRRGGSFHWPPTFVQYPWEALQGAMAMANVLYRAGYVDVFAAQDRALLRAVQFLYAVEWVAEGDDTWQLPLIDFYYGTELWDRAPTREGKNVGWTGVTHPPTPVAEGGGPPGVSDPTRPRRYSEDGEPGTP